MYVSKFHMPEIMEGSFNESSSMKLQVVSNYPKGRFSQASLWSTLCVVLTLGAHMWYGRMQSRHFAIPEFRS